MESYDSYYFAFIDILGFKQIVKEMNCSEIAGIFSELTTKVIVSREINDSISVPVIPPEDIHYYIMSDSVCIYIKDSIAHALPILTFLCMNLQVRMLCQDVPIFVRGSISRGEIYQDHGVLFGPALVDACLRAENLARVPRIIIPAQLIDETSDGHERAMLNGFSYVDYDGFYVNYYIDYFCCIDTTIPFRDAVDSYINRMLSTSMDQSLRDKYLYVKSRMDFCKQQRANNDMSSTNQG